MTGFGWDYPPGVSGNEFEIAGPDYEAVELRACDEDGCGFEGEVEVRGYRQERWWDCPQCGTSTTEVEET